MKLGSGRSFPQPHQSSPACSKPTPSAAIRRPRGRLCFVRLPRPSQKTAAQVTPGSRRAGDALPGGTCSVLRATGQRKTPRASVWRRSRRGAEVDMNVCPMLSRPRHHAQAKTNPRRRETGGGGTADRRRDHQTRATIATWGAAQAAYPTPRGRSSGQTMLQAPPAQAKVCAPSLTPFSNSARRLQSTTGRAAVRAS